MAEAEKQPRGVKRNFKRPAKPGHDASKRVQPRANSSIAMLARTRIQITDELRRCDSESSRWQTLRCVRACRWNRDGESVQYDLRHLRMGMVSATFPWLAVSFRVAGAGILLTGTSRKYGALFEARS